MTDCSVWNIRKRKLWSCAAELVVLQARVKLDAVAPTNKRSRNRTHVQTVVVISRQASWSRCGATRHPS
jgi:hypothetical protein